MQCHNTGKNKNTTNQSQSQRLSLWNADGGEERHSRNTRTHFSDYKTMTKKIKLTFDFTEIFNNNTDKLKIITKALKNRDNN